MAIDSHYIPAFSIEDVLLDKDTGAPLSGGLVYFEQDDQRGILKPVYQITGTSPNYTYTQLPNPMTLSSIGTFEDALGNPVIPYFYPYNSEGDVEYYYVRVTSSGDVPQFDREAVPYVGIQDNAEVLSVITNELSNPQFIETVYSGSHVYSFSAATNQVVNIAPDWDLIVTCPTTGTVTITQATPAGSLNIPTNPGTILTITSAGITSLKLRQRIFGSPNLWGSGYLSATFVAKTYSGTAVTLNMYYSQSNGTIVDQLLVAASLPASGDYEVFSNAFLIPQSNSTQTFPNAYIDIYFDIPLSIQIDLTSVMVAFTGNTAINNIAYDQESYARQIDHLYHYAYPIMPVGAVIDFAGSVLPANYLLCNGAAISRTDFARLFAAIGTTWGVGDGSTTFNLPLLADKVTAGTGGTLGALGATVGANTHAITYAEMPAHNHAGSTATAPVGGGGGGAIPTAANLSTIGSVPVTLNIAAAGGGTLNVSGSPMSLVQSTAMMQKIIRYR